MYIHTYAHTILDLLFVFSTAFRNSSFAFVYCRHQPEQKPGASAAMSDSTGLARGLNFETRRARTILRSLRAQRSQVRGQCL